MRDGQADKMSVVDGLLVFIVIVFIIQWLVPGFTELFYFDPSIAINEPWRFLTSVFLHGGVAHLFFNLYALYLFGKIVENKIGSGEFLKVFLIAGISGSFFYWITYVLGITNAPALGASGAIFGIMGVAAMLFPEMRIMIFPIMIPISMRTAVVVWIVLEFLGVFNPYSGIASAAHLGGLFVGLIYGKMVKNKLMEEYYFFLE